MSQILNILRLTMALARHRFCTGQETQPGDLGVHTVAPNSIIPWLKSAGWSGSTISSAKLLNIPKTNYNCTLFKPLKLSPCKFNDFTSNLTMNFLIQMHVIIISVYLCHCTFTIGILSIIWWSVITHCLPQFVLDWLTCGISSNDPHSAQNSNHITINDPCSLQIHSKLATLHYSYSIISSMNKTVHLFQISRTKN